MAAESTGPVRRTGRVRRAKPGSSEAELQPADATPPAGAFVALTGLAMAAGTAGSPDRLRTGLHALGPRPKLMVGRADDQAEVEADAMADAVLHRLLQPPTTDLEHAGESESVIGPLRRAAVSALAPMARRVTGIGAEGGEVDSQTEQSLRAASSTGAPLAPAVRREYEDAFGADLSAVRVHSGPASAQLNSALGAQAFTLGSDIYFGNRVPSTAAAADRHLMAHELAHTLQDGGGVHRAMVRRLAVQITPTWQQAEDEEMIEQAVLPSAEAQPHTDTQPHIEALLDEGANSSGETMMLEPMVTEGRPTKAWELVIESVAIVGRPTTLFTGSMGDHMTAFVISRKGVENAVFGQPFPVAVKELDDLVADLKKLPGWDLVDSLKPAEDEEVLETTTEGATTEVATTQGEDISSALASSALVLIEAPDLDVEE
ncbi:MAG: hypothetical protein QOI26_2112, partial [Pseudonocardiales bacterium]|nr:hypothetical protein [Pseudonocardiales bacterium]